MTVHQRFAATFTGLSLIPLILRPEIATLSMIVIGFVFLYGFVIYVDRKETAEYAELERRAAKAAADIAELQKNLKETAEKVRDLVLAKGLGR